MNHLPIFNPHAADGVIIPTPEHYAKQLAAAAERQSDLFGPVPPAPFFNTTHERGPELVAAVDTALLQEEKVAAIFRLVGRDPSTGLPRAVSPSAVHAWGVEHNRETWLLTSVRRSISNLTERGALVKTHDKVRGPFGRNEYLWRLA